MVSQTITAKKLLALLEKNRAICEASPEYPSLTQSVPPRHLCTCTKASTTSQTSSGHKLLNQTTSEHHEKGADKQAKQSKDPIEIIELFPEEETDQKLYRKSRYQPTRRSVDEIMDNTD